MVRFATIGSNFVVDWMLTAGKTLSDFRHEAVYSRTEERGREFADKWGVKKVYTDLDALAADPDIDAVYVASPNLCHKEQARKMLEAGKHVLCEKPVVLNVGDFDELAALARQKSLIFMEAMRPVHGEGIATIRRLLPRLGRLRRVSLEFCQYSSRYDKFQAGIVENAFKPELGNGALMDIGVYCVHLAEAILGAPETVTGATCFLPGGADGQGTLLLGYPDRLCDIRYAKITQSINVNVIQGEQGLLILDGTSIIRSVTLRPRKGEEQVFPIVQPEGGDMVWELTDFIDQVQSGRADPQWETHSRNALVIMDNARAAMGVDFKAKP